MKIRIMVIAMLGMMYAVNMQSMERPLLQRPLSQWQEYLAIAKKLQCRSSQERYYYNADTGQREELPIENLNKDQINDLIKEERKYLVLAINLPVQQSDADGRLTRIYERLGDIAYHFNNYSNAMAMYMMAMNDAKATLAKYPGLPMASEILQRLKDKKAKAIESRIKATEIRDNARKYVTEADVLEARIYKKKSIRRADTDQQQEILEENLNENQMNELLEKEKELRKLAIQELRKLVAQELNNELSEEAFSILNTLASQYERLGSIAFYFKDNKNAIPYYNLAIKAYTERLKRYPKDEHARGELMALKEKRDLVEEYYNVDAFTQSNLLQKQKEFIKEKNALQQEQEISEPPLKRFKSTEESK